MPTTPTPSADQVAALINRAASGRLLPAEQRILGDLLTRARASLAGQGAALTRTRATLVAAIAERDQLRQQLAARDDQHAPATVDCPLCPAKAGRPCRAPSGQQVPYHAPRRIAAQQQAGVGQ